jgi:hypothetical protein
MNHTTKVRKFNKFDIFPNATFELGESIKNQTKTRPETNGLKLWLGQLDCKFPYSLALYGPLSPTARTGGSHLITP